MMYQFLPFLLVSMGLALDPCDFPGPFPSQAASRSTACACDGNGTVCQPNDFCITVPPDDFDVDSLPEDLEFDDATRPDYSTFQCYVIPCDDVSGDWIYFAAATGGDTFSVLATITVTQNNCDSDWTVTTPQETVVYYAGLYWREVYWLYMFLTVEDRALYSESVIRDETTGHPKNSSILIQNFESSEPQCGYIIGLGEFVAEIPDGAFGLLSRQTNVTKLYSVGDTVTREDVPLESDCPDGYPRQWIQPETHSKVTDQPSVASSMTPSVVPSSAMYRSAGIGLLLMVSLTLFAAT